MKTNIEDAKLDESEDLLSEYIGKICEIYTKGHQLPLYGKVVRLSPKFVFLERRDGRMTMVAREIIVQMQPTKVQRGRAE